MKHILFSFCLLSYLWSFSQTTPVDNPISITKLGDWVTQKVSGDDVAKALGTSTLETITPNETIWQYKFNRDVCTLYFDKDRKLTRVTFINQVPVAVNNLSYEKIKAAKTASSKKEIMATFGRPSQLSATGMEEVWYYSTAEKTLLFYFDLANADHIKRYSYSEDSRRETALTSSVPTAFHVGETTISEVEGLLGKPSKLTLESEGQEQWFYQSQRSTLLVMFDKQSKLRDFSFQRNGN